MPTLEERFNEKFKWNAPDFSLSKIEKRPYELAAELLAFIEQEIERARQEGEKTARAHYYERVASEAKQEAYKEIAEMVRKEFYELEEWYATAKRQTLTYFDANQANMQTRNSILRKLTPPKNNE